MASGGTSSTVGVYPEVNKAQYTTGSVAYGWAGAVMRFRKLFDVISHSGTDQPTNGRTDRPTE